MSHSEATNFFLLEVRAGCSQARGEGATERTPPVAPSACHGQPSASSLPPLTLLAARRASPLSSSLSLSRCSFYFTCRPSCFSRLHAAVCLPYRQALEHLEYPKRLRKLLLTPEREVAVELALLRDNGEVATFNAYRVQHDNSRGPYKGGLRYHPDVDLDDVRRWGACMVVVGVGGWGGGGGRMFLGGGKDEGSWLVGRWGALGATRRGPCVQPLCTAMTAAGGTALLWEVPPLLLVRPAGAWLPCRWPPRDAGGRPPAAGGCVAWLAPPRLAPSRGPCCSRFQLAMLRYASA
jgi:hypothetical protein